MTRLNDTQVKKIALSLARKGVFKGQGKTFKDVERLIRDIDKDIQLKKNNNKDK